MFDHRTPSPKPNRMFNRVNYHLKTHQPIVDITIFEYKLITKHIYTHNHSTDTQLRCPINRFAFV